MIKQLKSVIYFEQFYKLHVIKRNNRKSDKNNFWKAVIRHFGGNLQFCRICTRLLYKIDQNKILHLSGQTRNYVISKKKKSKNLDNQK